MYFKPLVSSFALAMALLSTSVLAKNESPLPKQLQSCASIESSLQRLDCYDNLARSVSKPAASASISSEKTAPATSATAASVVASTPVVTPAQNSEAVKTTQQKVDEFGAKKKPQADKELQEITSTISVIKRDPYKRLRLTLANKQVWAQTDYERLSIRTGDKVIIEKGAFGGFKLRKADGGKKISVKRVN
ncbi:hypothetical protein [Paraferrimonas haliotis]|uniref:Uncharacterized protein n=1 Tax=Paraferrimonas haliotis TaxID=2013866 RepID=A0AA37TQ09_9GAMM|nr:hypothetical protein [Paraferrimonas haliotis]GLS82287.1 hypothetical protein GCM10007894_02640 [Paraferrimonas haliotis]